MTLEGFRPLDGRARWAAIALGLCVAADLFQIVVDWLEIDLLGRVIDGEDVAASELEASDGRQDLAAFLYVATLVAAAIFFLRWFHLAYRNVDPLDPGRRRHLTAWAIGGWFVPVLNLWRPKQIANDIWRGSEPEGRWEADAALPRPPLLLTAWWTAWIVVTVTAGFAGRGFLDEGTPVSTRDSDWADLAYSLVDIAAAVLAVVVVLRVTERQGERAGRSRRPGRSSRRAEREPAAQVSAPAGFYSLAPWVGVGSRPAMSRGRGARCAGGNARVGRAPGGSSGARVSVGRARALMLRGRRLTVCSRGFGGRRVSGGTQPPFDVPGYASRGAGRVRSSSKSSGSTGTKPARS